MKLVFLGTNKICFSLSGFENNDVKRKSQIFRLTYHVRSINSSPNVTLLTLKKLIVKNPANASQVTFSAIEHNRYKNDLLLSSDSLIE